VATCEHAWWNSAPVFFERKPPRKGFFFDARSIGTCISFGGMSAPKCTSTSITSGIV